MASRKAIGHLAGDPVPDWHDSVLSGAGTSLYSTAGDMLRYLGAQLRPERSPLRDAIELAHSAPTSPSTKYCGSGSAGTSARCPAAGP
ncbi:hypothetical protein SALBM311S_00089 [Streptomyces alboniger]